MEELFNMLTSSARIRKSKKEAHTISNDVSIALPTVRDYSESADGDDEAGTKRKGDMTREKAFRIHREEIAAFRNKLQIRLGSNVENVPDPIASFDELSMPSWWTPQAAHVFRSVQKTLLANLNSLASQWTHPTPVQMQCLPTLLDSRRDVVACAPTGSGKSGAFLIPILFLTCLSDSQYHRPCTTENAPSTEDSHGKIRSLVLAPSRELASQLHREAVRLGTGKIHGFRAALLSKSSTPNVGKRGLDLLVSTPLRLVECLSKLDLSRVRMVVLDEADRLLDATDGNSGFSKHRHDVSNDDGPHAAPHDEGEGATEKHSGLHTASKRQSGSRHGHTFLEQMDVILSAVPPTAIRALFSATIGPRVRTISEYILRNPVDLTIGNTNTDIQQSLLFVGREAGKLLAIRQCIQNSIRPPVLVFVQSQERAKALYSELLYDGIRVDVIHAGRTQASRDLSISNFRKGETWVLICTDLVARGVDFKAVNMVINYDLPTTAVTYVHRIGRTGRAGRKGGVAITLFTESDFDNIKSIANVMKLSGCPVPDWILSLKKNAKKSNVPPLPPKRANIDTTPIYDKRNQGKRKRYVQNSVEKKKNKTASAKNLP